MTCVIFLLMYTYSKEVKLIMKNKYTAIMIDVVDSKKYDNRNEVQEFLKCIIEYLNNIFSKSLKKPLMFSAGDEIQGLFSSSLAAYLCSRFFMMICFPVKVRIGVGYGELAFDNDKWSSSELDGEVYHNARYAIESFAGKSSFGIRINTKAKKDKFLNTLFYSSQIIQRQQSINAQEVKLITELLFPIYDNEIMDSYLHYKEELIRVLEMRKDIILNAKLSFSNAKIGRSHYTNKLNLDMAKLVFHSFDISVHEVVMNSDLIIDNIWKKGMSTIISEVLGTTRQNIDQHIRLGKIEENRTIDFTIACWIIEEGYR